MNDWLQLLAPARLLRPRLMPLHSASPPARGRCDGLQRWHQALAAAGLSTLMQSPGALSVLAPTDAAFESQLLDLGQSWPVFCANKYALRRLLLGHVLPRTVSRRELSLGEPLTALTQAVLRSGFDAAGLWLQDANQRQARVLLTERGSSGFTVHRIDCVLLPPRLGLLQQLEQQAELSEFSAAIKHCGLDSLLRGSGPFTVLAPSNAGFERLAPRLGLRRRELLQNPALLASVLSLHLLPGRWLSNELPWGGALKTVQGAALHFAALGLVGAGEAAQALRADSDQLSHNGVIHRIDAAILPCP